MSQSQPNDTTNQESEGTNDGLPNERNPLENGPRNNEDTTAGEQSEQQHDLDGFRYLRAFNQPPGEQREFVMDGFDGGDAEELSDEEQSDDGTGADQDTFASRSESEGGEASDAEEDTAAARPDAERQRLRIFRRVMRRRVQRLQDLVQHNHVHGNASAHLYLGLNMQDLPSADVEQNDNTLELPLVVCPGVILFPGEVLPLRVSDPAQVAYLSSQTEPNPEDAHRMQLAVLSDGVRTGVIGTIAEIKARRSSHAELMLIGEGIKRFKLLQLTPNARPGLHLARVEVLRDVEQPWRPLKKLPYEDMAQPFPSWVYEPYHVELLMEKADRAMIAVQGWHTESEQSRSVEEIGTRPVPKHHPLQFSYWLSANLPLSDSSRQELLEIDDASIRLRRCIQHLERVGQMYLCCKRCRAPLSRKQHIVTVPGADGTVGAYVNPVGVVHQTVTISELLHDRCLWYDPRPPTTEDTWFPNYAWRVAYCGRCYCHLGWKFTSTFDDAVLQEFWGLSRRAIDDRPTSESEEQDEGQPDEPDEQDDDDDNDDVVDVVDVDAHAIEHDQAGLPLLALLGDWRRMLWAGPLAQNEAEEDDDEDERSPGSDNNADEL